MVLLRVLPFALSSVLVAVLDYFRAIFPFQQQVIAILIILTIMLGNQYFQKQKDLFKNFLSRLTMFLLLFFGSCLIQLIVLSTGGFFSPVLILFHLFALFLSFLYSFWASLAFLSFSLGILITQLFLNPIIKTAFDNDQVYVLLYVISFLVVIPLMDFVSRTYHFKGLLLEKVNRYLKFSEARDRQILSGLKDMVFLLNKDLKIFSINNAVQTELKIDDKAILNKPFFEVVKLKDSSGEPASIDSLSINSIVQDKSNRTLENFTFLSPYRTQSFKVTLHIRPILDLEGNVYQIIVVVSHAFIGSEFQHQDLKDSLTKNKALSDGLAMHLRQLNNKTLLSNYYLIIKAERDIRLAQELEDHPIEKNISIKNLASIILSTTQQKIPMAQSLGILLNTQIPKENIEYQSPTQNTIVNQNIIPTVTSFSTAIDPEWFSTMMDKLLDLAIFLNTQPEKPVHITIRRTENIINVLITANTSLNVIENSNLILSGYSEKLSKNTRLILSSRLEPFIIRSIASQLEVRLSVEKDTASQTLTFLLSMDRKPTLPVIPK